jgi:hypothetical protein
MRHDPFIVPRLPVVEQEMPANKHRPFPGRAIHSPNG